MHAPMVILALFSPAVAALAMPLANAADFAQAARSDTPGIVLVGGMSGGGGGMSGGGGGGMSGGGGTSGGGGGSMSGGGTFGGSMFGFGQPAQAQSNPNTSTDNYTYQCVTPAGNCAFVAPAWMRETSLKSGAGCSCDGQGWGRVQ